LSKLSLSNLLKSAQAQLKKQNIETAALDARILLQAVTGWSEADLILKADDTLSAQMQEVFKKLLLRRLNHEPVARIIGTREFYGLDLALSPATLEPRCDSETLVDAVLSWSEDTSLNTQPCQILDLGTGTGALLLAILANRPKWQGLGVDLSWQACQTAQHNAQKHGLDTRCAFVNSSWCTALKPEPAFDIIVSNPPYIPSSTIDSLNKNVKDYDPMLALDGGEDGLDAYRLILQDARHHLKPDGMLFLEIGFDQKDPISTLILSEAYDMLQIYNDLSQWPRVLRLKSKKTR
jgi:release factor glutamine methyltransferase